MDAVAAPRLQADAPETSQVLREFAWTPADFRRVQDLIYRHAGIRLHDGKHAMVYSRLARRLRETGHKRFSEYLQWVESEREAAQRPGGQEGAEWQEFVNALTTNLTSFFREPHHFELLARHLADEPARRWRIWCNAASTGQEPYSIAMTCAEVLGDQADFRIVASDIDSRVLAQATQGTYPEDALQGLSESRRRRFFLRGRGSKAGLVRVRPELQRHIDFMQLNLVAERWPAMAPDGGFDVIFCRNVMIYFDAATQHRLAKRMHGLLVPDGLLFIGHAENLSDARELFSLRGKTTYVRR